MNVDLTRDLKSAGMSDAEVCAWAYFAAVRQQCADICIIHPGGWERTYTLSEVRGLLMRTPALLGEVNMGRNRFNRTYHREGDRPSSLL